MRCPSLWPDPNSPVLSKIDFGAPLSELFKWLDVRDTLLGQNYKEQGIEKALRLARDCKHPDAVWLTSIFEGTNVSTIDEASNVFLLHENDARALSLSWQLKDRREGDLSLLRRAAEMGCAFACATLCGELFYDMEEEAFLLAKRAAVQHERDGFNVLGWSYRNGRARDVNLAKENYLIASELGHIMAANNYALMLRLTDSDRWLWLSRAAVHGQPYYFIGSFAEQVHQFNSSGSGSSYALFCIGWALKGRINLEKKELFGRGHPFFDFVVGPANQAVSFYESQVKAAHLAVFTWTHIGIRNRIVKDLRVLIGKM